MLVLSKDILTDCPNLVTTLEEEEQTTLDHHHACLSFALPINRLTRSRGGRSPGSAGRQQSFGSENGRMATTVAKGQPVELTSHTSTLMDVEMDPSAQSAEPEEDLYTRLKTLQRQLEFYEIQVHNCKPMIYHQHTGQFRTPAASGSSVPAPMLKVPSGCLQSHFSGYCRRSTSKKSKEA